MIYGIQAQGSVRLTEVARALDEPISLKKTDERLSNNLSDPRILDVLSEQVLSQGASRIKEDSLLIIDPSDLCKKYAKKMEHLAEIRDGSEDKIGKGYWMCEVVGAETGDSKFTPLAQSLWSQKAPGHFSENEEILKLVRRVYEATDRRRPPGALRGAGPRGLPFPDPAAGRSPSFVQGRSHRDEEACRVL